MPSRMSYDLEAFLGDVKHGVDSNNLSGVLSINPRTANHIALLQPALQAYTNTHQLESIVENCQFYRGDWPAFETLLTKYLVYVRDMDPWSLLDSIDLLVDFYQALSVALGNKQYSPALFELTYQTTKLLIPLCKFVDSQMMKIENRLNNYPRVSYLSTVVLKAVNNIRSSPALEEPGTASYTVFVLMELCTALCNMYIYIDSPILCNNVFSNMNVLKLDKSLITRPQLIRYRFVLGKFHLLQSNYFLAYHHFQWCFYNCHQNTGEQTFATILRYLIPCGLLVGKVVQLQLLESYGRSAEMRSLVRLYSPMIRMFREGDLNGFLEYVTSNKTYFKAVSLYVGFLQRVRILILRNLLFKVYRMTGGLKFEHARRALQLALNTQVDATMTDNVLMALIDANLIRAKMTVARNVILPKSNPFPAPHEIYRVKYAKGNRESWLD